MDDPQPLLLPVFAQGEWAAKRFYGDPLRAVAFLPVASAMLGELKTRMAQGGVSYGHRSVQFSDGTRIRVLRDGGRNLITIDTRASVRPASEWAHSFGFLCYPKGGGLAVTGWIPPRLKGDPPPSPYGTRAKQALRLDDFSPGYITRLAVLYDPSGPGHRLKVGRMTPLCVGNQFSFDRFDVYSWWGSPTGDGPAYEVDDPQDLPPWMYRPFLLGSWCYRLPFWTLPNPPVCPTQLYKNGHIWLNAGTAIGDFRLVSIKQARRRDRAVGLLIGMDLQAYTVRGQRLSTGAALVDVRREVRADDSEVVSWPWPWRINASGTEAATLAKIRTPVGPAGILKLKAVVLIKVALSYSETKGFQRTGITVQRTSFMETTTQTYDASYKNIPLSPVQQFTTSAPDIAPEFKSRTVTRQSGGLNATYTVQTTQATDLTVNVPFALSYEGDTLLIGSMRYQFQHQHRWQLQTDLHGVDQAQIQNLYSARYQADPTASNASNRTRRIALAYAETRTVKQGVTARGEDQASQAESVTFTTKNKQWAFQYPSQRSTVLDYARVLDGTLQAGASVWGYYDGWHQGGAANGIDDFWYDFDIQSRHEVVKNERSVATSRRLGVVFMDLKTDTFMSIDRPTTTTGEATYAFQASGAEPNDGSRSWVYPCNPASGSTGCNAYLTGYGIVFHPPVKAPPTEQFAGHQAVEARFAMNLEIYGQAHSAHQATVGQSQSPYAFQAFADHAIDDTPKPDYERHDTQGMENLPDDLINQMVDIRTGLSCSIVLDPRPTLLEKPPSYLTSVSLNIGGQAEPYLKRSCSLVAEGDPDAVLKYGLPDLTLHPVGLY